MRTSSFAVAHARCGLLSRLGGALLVSLIVAGCATSEPAAPTRTASAEAATSNVDGDKVICRRELPTGQQIWITVCRKVSDMDRQAAEARETMESRRPGPASPDSVTGGR